MDIKDIKSLLKQARNAIKEKDFENALKYCKAILKADKNNYNAWVFVGIATQEINQIEQAVYALKKAIEISPNGILAWQGLGSLYEKQDQVIYFEELLHSYQKLYELFSSDKEKQLEIFKKWIHLLKSTGKEEKLIEISQLQLKMSDGDSLREFSFWKSIFEELKTEKNISNSLENLFNIQHKCDAISVGGTSPRRIVDLSMKNLQREKACVEIIHNENASEFECQDILTFCIKPLYESGNYDKALHFAEDLLCKFAHHISSLEFLIVANLDCYIRTKGFSPVSRTIFLNRKIKLQSGLENILKGTMHLISGHYIQAVMELSEGLKKLPSNLQGWCIMTEAQLALHRYADAEKSAKSGLHLAKLQFNTPHYVLGKFYLLLGQALFGRRNWNCAIQAIEKSVEYIGRTVEILFTFCRILLGIEQIHSAEKICDEVSSKFPHCYELFQLQGCIHLKQKQFREALQKFQQAVAVEESSFTLHLIAIVLWETGECDKAFKLFLKAAKLDPYYSENFLYIGKFFMNYKKDIRKGMECFQRSFELDKNNEEIAKFLSVALKNSGRNEEHVSFLKSIAKEAYFGRCKWVWVELGLLQLDRNACSDAVFSLQNAVRLEPEDSYVWECIGDAYLKRGSHESALRAYQKASELSSDASYSLFQISTILKVRGFHLPAIKNYENVLLIQDTYVPALIGLAEALLYLAKESLKMCIFGRVRYCCQEALKVLARVITTTTGLSNLWKLAGDACTLLFHLSEKYFPVEVPFVLNLQNCGKDLTCCKKQILNFGAVFYATGLHLHRNVSVLWHDLGVNIYLQSLFCDSREEVLELSKKALLCLQKAVSLSPMYHFHWTALGVVACSKGINDMELAQHAFVKSIEIEGNNSEAYTNLGVLYLACGDMKLAHKAFAIAQSLEPTYPICWLGQAIIAFSVKHNETVDLFRHAATLGSHVESLLGYGRMVCNLLLDVHMKNTDLYKYNIMEMDAIVFATDCLVKYTSNNEDNPEAFNMLGMLLERQGTFSTALKSYKRSFDLLQAHDNRDDLEKVCINYARLLSCTGQHQKAIQHYVLVKKVDTALLCSFGSTLQKNRQYNEAFKLFNRALDFCQNAEEKSHILVAMAMVAINMKEQDAPNYLNLFLQSSQEKPSSLNGLLALCADGIMKGDTVLTLASLKELEPHKFHSFSCTPVTFMEASFYHFRNDKKSALRKMLKILHCQPNNSSLWIQIGSYLLQWNSSNAILSATCGKICLYHNGNKVLCSQMLSLCDLASGNHQNALISAQKAVHLHPGKINNWTILTAACYVDMKVRNHLGWIFRFVKLLAKEQEYSSNKLIWLLTMEVLHYIYSGDVVSANRLVATLSDVISGTSMHSFLHIIIAVLKVIYHRESLDILIRTIRDHPMVFFGWEVLMQLLMQSNQYQVMERVLEEFAAASETYFPVRSLFSAVQSAVFSYNIFHNSNITNECWVSTGIKRACNAVRTSPNAISAHFIQGLLAFETKNLKLAQRSFEQALACCNTNEGKWMKMVSKILLSTLIQNK